MRAKAGILLIICLLLLVGTVGAAVGIPDTAIITSDKSYLTANGVDQCTITVSVTNTTTNPGPVVGAKVNFYVLDPALGIINFPFNVSTDTNGKATRIFYVKTKSGNADIRANVSYLGVPGVYNFTTQKIDHDKAHFAIFSHPLEGNVGANVPVNISFTDYYGNPIDQIINSGQQHTINLHVHGPTPDNCSFVGYGHDIISRSLDTNGNVSVMVKLSDGAGPNSITMDPFEEILTPVPRIITGISTDVSDMEQLFNPDFPPQVPADGMSKFSIQYTLFDKFRNPVSQQEVWINTSIAGEEFMNKTDSLGRLMVTYGPRSTIGIINITATAVKNKTVTKSYEVEFTSTAAYAMVVTANPEFMPSLDVNSNITSDITAAVTDVLGNPVANEIVSFSMGTVEYPEGPYNVTSSPSLSKNSTISDAEGLATVTFIPGSFSPVNRTSSTGKCTITATWNTTHKKYITVTWKNYPYLSVKTMVNPQTTAVNDTVDITISLKGDGYAMGPKPIDVVMCTDRSGSMLLNGTDNIADDRMVYAMAAAKIFNSKMGSKDRVGLVSFGDLLYSGGPNGVAELRKGQSNTYGNAFWVGRDTSWPWPSSNDEWYGDNPYISKYYKGNPRNYGTTQYASIDQNLSLVRTTIDTSIGNMVPAGGTPMREGLYRSVKMHDDFPRADAVKAVILLTDGAWNTGGNPQGGSGVTSFPDVLQGSIITWAKGKNIAIYTIALGSDPSQTELQAYATETGGKFYSAPTADQLSEIYTNISQELIKDAGVNTTMVTDFSNVNVTSEPKLGKDVYDYVHNVTASTKITWQDVPKVTNVTNQTNDWADQKLNFTIGTMKIGQTWEATFRLKVKMSGSIDVFGPGSALYFNNGAETLTLPHTFLTVVPDLNVTGFGVQTIAVSSTCPVQVQQTFILPITWTTMYIGPPNTISDEVLYISESGAHVPFYHGSYPVSGDSILTRSAQFDMRTVPPGNYSIQVISKSNLVTSTSQSCDNYNYNAKGVTFIKLD